MSTITTTPVDDLKSSVAKIFAAQRDNMFAIGKTTAKQRIHKLDKLRSIILSRKQDIRDALYKDFRKPAEEVDLTEIYVLTSDIKHIKGHLRQWMAPKRVSTPLSLLGSSSWYQYESKGVCLIISPWNFPFQLTLGPLISAIAAGNCCIVKPSEHTPHTSQLIEDIISELFEPNEVKVIQGGVEASQALLELPFNHIFFTGAPSIGKIVMAAAAKNLSSVTLELGGKSPTIVDETANIDTAAMRIAWGKFTNNGQICIAPDHVYVHHSVKDQLIKKIKSNLDDFYGSDVQSTDDYNRMVTTKHFNRVNHLIVNAIDKGANLLHGGQVDESENFISPTILDAVPVEADIMSEEIFGPVLPIIEYRDLDQLLKKIQKEEKPLALYIYSSSRKNIDKVTANTRAGGTAINNNNLQFSNANLPFGGSNNSGIGKSHGKFGFQAFSDARGFYKQYLPSAVDRLMPPYTDVKRKLIDWTIKWF